MRVLHRFFQVAEKLARGEVPQSVVKMVKLGRMTALSKLDGGVRGIVAGDVVRRLVARIMAQTVGESSGDRDFSPSVRTVHQGSM